jgi:hypothetical protein
MPGSLDAAGVIVSSIEQQSLGTVSGGAVAVPPGIVDVTISANTTFTFPAPVAGQKGELIITQDATGSRTGTYAATSGSVLFSGGTKTLSTTAAYVDKISWVSDGTNVYCTLGVHFS